MALEIRSRVDGRETDVDSLLLEAINHTLDTEQPAVLVVATGDGAGFLRNTGFLAVCHRARALGWAVEVLAWSRSCHRALRSFAEAGHGFTDLDHHYQSITHVDAARRARPVSWRRRAIATFPEHRCAA